MSDSLNNDIAESEFLYRGIIEKNWDYENNRISSAAFKDSQGVSVDRDNFRDERECVDFLNKKKDFFAVCKIQNCKVIELNAMTKYLPIDSNIFHSEIHDSHERVQLKGSKPKKLRDASLLVFLR